MTCDEELASIPVDIRRHRYVGVIDYPQRAVLVYAARGIDNFCWPQKTVMAEKQMYDRFRNNYFPRDRADNAACAVLLVDSADTFN